jgi:hypothetical protein
MRHVFGFCACHWFTCLLMFVMLVYLNACVFIAYLVSCIRIRVYMFLNSKFRISLLVLSFITKKRRLYHLSPFAPLVRVCFGDKRQPYACD